MSTFARRAFFAAFFLTVALVACGGGYGITPGGSPQQPAAAPMMAQTVPDFVRSLLPDTSPFPKCTAAKLGLPGDYTAFFSAGNVKSGKFTSIAAYSLWFTYKWIGAKPPTPSPSPSPTTTPKPPAEYVYYGTYVLTKSKQQGCAYLLAYVSGKPPKGAHFNASEIGTPIFKTYAKTTGAPVKTGKLIATASLTSTGGSGKVTLMSGTTVYDTGTVTLTGRVTLP